ncbi:hypothetical protein, partial [Xanthomonas oryzae]
IGKTPRNQMLIYQLWGIGAPAVTPQSLCSCGVAGFCMGDYASGEGVNCTGEVGGRLRSSV